MRRIGLFLLLAAAAALGTGCIIEPPADIRLEYSMNQLDYDNTFNNIEITYWVKNSGEYDLDDIQLYIEIDRDDNGTMDLAGWTSAFDLNAGSSTTRIFRYYSFTAPGAPYPDYDIDERVIVTRIGMDNPPDE